MTTAASGYFQQPMLSSYAQPRLLVWNDSGRVAGDGRRRSQVPGFGPNQQSWAVPRGALRLLDCTEAVAQSREKVTVPVMVGRTGHYHLNSSPCPNRSAVCGVINLDPREGWAWRCRGGRGAVFAVV